jgi:hypothetical protein
MTQLANYTREPLSVDLPPVQAEQQPDTSPVPHGYAPRVPAGTTRPHETIEKVTTQFEKYLGTIDPNHYTADGMRAAIDRFADTDAGRAIDTAVTEATSVRDEAIAAVERERSALVPIGDAAQESRNARYWERTRRILDSKKDLGAVTPMVTKLIDEADPSELGVLLDEMKPYLAARGIPSAALIESGIRAKAPQYAKAIQRVPIAEKALQMTQYNAQALRTRMKNTAHPAAWQRPKFVDDRKFDPNR